MTVTILSDSMAKQVGNLQYTDLQPFPGATFSRLQHKIATHPAGINYKYTILLIGTNDISSFLSVGEIMSYYENLVTYITHGLQLYLSSLQSFQVLVF